jgi:hypothetical protein
MVPRITEDASKAGLGIGQEVPDVVFESTGVVLEVVLEITERVLEVVLKTAELLLHAIGTEDMDRPDSELPVFIAVEMVAAPIVKLAVETEAFLETAVAKGAGGLACTV